MANFQVAVSTKNKGQNEKMGQNDSKGYITKEKKNCLLKVRDVDKAGMKAYLLGHNENIVTIVLLGDPNLSVIIQILDIPYKVAKQIGSRSQTFYWTDYYLGHVSQEGRLVLFSDDKSTKEERQETAFPRRRNINYAVGGQR